MDNNAKENGTEYSVNQNNNDILLTVIVPCFNEINTIDKVIKKIKTSSVQDKEIIIVDDFSTDGSREYLKNFYDKQVTIKFHTRNKGKGAAIRTGIKSAKGKIIIIQGSF